MKKAIPEWHIYFLVASLFVLGSCSKGGSGGGGGGALPSITTSAATSINGTSVVLGGNITSDGGSTIFLRGICWGTSVDPTIGTGVNSLSDGINSTGAFSFTLSTQLIPNTLYYVRAYCQNNSGLVYGNSVSFTTGNVVTTLDPVDITTTKVTLKGSITQDASVTSYPGFVMNTSPNPNINNFHAEISIIGSSNYQIDITGLTYNTTYYVRSYFQAPNGIYYYGAEKQLKTTGYAGPGGGFVLYDRGDNSAGYRYMEMWPNSLNYNIASGQGSYWGGTSTNIIGTLDQIGTGVANTNLIIAGTTQADCAAKLCKNFTSNGYNDWFLPSSEELLLLATSLRGRGITLAFNAWTSTQQDPSHAYTVYFNTTPNTFQTSATFKTSQYFWVLPVRRY